MRCVRSWTREPTSSFARRAEGAAVDARLAKSVESANGVMRVALEDGRRVEVPIEWFPRLRDATPEQRRDLRLIGGGIGIHWPQLDEDLTVRGRLFPHPEDAQRVS